MTPEEKRQTRQRREADLLRKHLSQAIDAADQQIDALKRELGPLKEVRAAVLPGILKTLDDFYRGATFAARNQFDGDINRIEARIAHLREQAERYRDQRDAIEGGE
jgi:predicted  nucleic acid-binding Zn-ribbon protein